MNPKIGKALVVGAGISGIRAALDLAENGYGVTLIDRAANIGGILSQLDHQFPTNHCGMCRMLPLVERDAGSQFCLRKGLFHDNIDLRLACELTAVDGEPGQFTTTLRQTPNPVDPQRCNGCGQCVSACPIDVPDEFNAGMTTHKAIYLPVPHQVPNPYRIDPAACTRCGQCAAVCPTDAIQLTDEHRQAFRILVVDDELVVRDSLKEWLDDEGFNVDMAESGEAALRLIDERTYSLMLSDVKMPGMDGVDLLKQARERQPDLTVVMMTAYATVETAVEAMKIGALDYLVKPFDPEHLVAMVVDIYTKLSGAIDEALTVGAIVLASGTSFADPREGKNTYGYGINPHVLTSLEFERLVSGTGPTGGQLTRPADGRLIKKVAWLQCVGSRDIQIKAEYCSSVCCMISIKEALLAIEKADDPIETAIFYMDMRTFGKSYQRYRDRAAARGVRFERARVHSVINAPRSGDPTLRYVSMDGTIIEETFDMVVLATGQRPAHGTEQLARVTDCTLNPWGFLATATPSPTAAERSGIFIAGSAGGLKDIGDSVIYASAAAAEAGRTLHATGGSLTVEPTDAPVMRDVSRQVPSVLIALCTCGRQPAGTPENLEAIAAALKTDPIVDRVVTIDRVCTADGWQQLCTLADDESVNRLLIGACHPYLFVKKLKQLSAQVGLPPTLMEVVDLQALQTPAKAESNDTTTAPELSKEAVAVLSMGIARLRRMDEHPPAHIDVAQKALVIGGGIAGMQAALAIAERGYPVALVEQTDRLGGNLNWLQRTLEGHDLQRLAHDVADRVNKHSQIDVRLNARISGAFGQVGSFHTTIASGDSEPFSDIFGTVVLATGGGEAPTNAYGHGRHPAIVTQKELETGLTEGRFSLDQWDTVVMIQCVESRTEPRNYCSRICCPTTLKQALAIKKACPETGVYVFYRDMMAPGFAEAAFTAARQAGVVFIPYDVQHPPEVVTPSGDAGSSDLVTIKGIDPVLGRWVEIDAGLLVLATGIISRMPVELAAAFGADQDPDGFFQAADSKWRPVDSLKEGVFACGITLSPRPVVDTIATAQAAAQRALRVLGQGHLPAAHMVADVRHSLCALCQRCIDTCPYQARMLNLDQDRILVNPAMCQGCGACAAVCPNGAAVLNGLDRPQMLDTIDAALA